MKISALIPTFNRRKFIFRALDSILSQSDPVDEIIVVDDGSEDGTAEAIDSQYGPLIKTVRQTNMGVSIARKRAIEEASGEWVAFLDSDDEWLPYRNRAFLNAIDRVPDKVGLIFGNTRFITDQGIGDTVFKLNGFNIDSDLYLIEDPLTELIWDVGRSRPCVLQSSLIRKRVATELSCFREGLRHSEDFLAGLQIASRYNFAAIPNEVTQMHRTSDLNSSSLEATWASSEDHRRAVVLAYECAANSTHSGAWRKLHAQSVRALCKWRAQNGMPIRRCAAEQFKCGISLHSVIFFCAALLGSSFFRLCFAAKKWMRVWGRYFSHGAPRLDRDES